MIIDCNMHWLPPELLTNDELMETYLNQVPRAYGDIAYTRMIPGTDIKEVVIQKPAGYINLNFGPETIDPEDRIKVMNEGRIDKAILKVPCFQEWLTLEQCIQVNDGMKKYADEHGQGRIERIGVVPPWGTKATVEEMERLDLSAAEKARKHLHENIYFDISHAPPWGKAQLECAVKVMGADHLLFGCSYPVRRQWLVDGVDFINALDISQEEKDLILGKNARNLFKIS